MINQSARLFTAIYGFLGVFQGLLSFAFYFFPSLDQAIPFLQAIPHMIPIHSTLHLGTALLALVIFYRGGERGAFSFAFGFGLFYIGLGYTGMITGQQFGLGLKPFDHPFHIFIGALGLLGAAPIMYLSFAKRKVTS